MPREIFEGAYRAPLDETKYGFSTADYSERFLLSLKRHVSDHVSQIIGDVPKLVNDIIHIRSQAGGEYHAESGQLEVGEEYDLEAIIHEYLHWLSRHVDIIYSTILAGKISLIGVRLLHQESRVHDWLSEAIIYELSRQTFIQMSMIAQTTVYQPDINMHDVHQDSTSYRRIGSFTRGGERIGVISEPFKLLLLIIAQYIISQKGKELYQKARNQFSHLPDLSQYTSPDNPVVCKAAFELLKIGEFALDNAVFHDILRAIFGDEYTSFLAASSENDKAYHKLVVRGEGSESEIIPAIATFSRFLSKYL